MATLLFSAIGTLVGGPLGGALGALAGRQVDSLILPRATREGPRLAELTLTTSSYGTPIPRQFGRMRVAGSVIWSTDLIEHRDRQSGGKGRPSTNSYSYSASFAVALSSRPLLEIGRIWADGKLLRDAAGDLKVGGTLRLHHGHPDQPADPLIAAAEGPGLCPAHRGLAYVVFEDLQLAEFGNRLPALTFEVIADTGPLSLGSLLEGIVDADVQATLPEGFTGLTADGPLADLLEMIDNVQPMDCNAAGDGLTIASESPVAPAVMLGPAALPSSDDGSGDKTGAVIRRVQPGKRPIGVLRYYDPERDFQPGAQRGVLRDPLSQARVIELPVSLTADAARGLIEGAIRRAEWGRQTQSYRSATLDPAIGPGTVVSVPGRPGHFKIIEWEWRASGVELTLERFAQQASAAPPGEPGRASTSTDVVGAPILLSAFELPWDGSGSAAATVVHVAASAISAGWNGAALFHELPDGGLDPLGPSGRQRAIMGIAETAIPAATPHLIDRGTELTVELAAADFELSPASFEALAQGANRALVGREIIQFAAAEPFGNKRWRLSQFLRGRGGSEAAIGGHTANERFLLLDGSSTRFDAAAAGIHPQSRIAAIGLADPAPIFTAIALPGATQRPLTPVHGKLTTNAAGDTVLAWTRRARGAWLWRDEVDVPLIEQDERYVVTFGTDTAELARWEVGEPRITISGSLHTTLVTTAPGGRYRVQQLGSHGLSEPHSIAL